jgi:tetrachlorobenzoquinone reductase
MSIRDAVRDIKLYEFEHADGFPLPAVEPGAHIDVMLPNGLMRQYSLINAEPSPRYYTVAVKLDPKSRGGSRYIHDSLRVGQVCKIAGPRNNFPLNEEAAATVFFAGGIGITPIWCMVQRLAQIGKEWTLHYACRTRMEAAFLDNLVEYDCVHLHFDDENAGRVLDISNLVAAAAPEAHLYCCGPRPMLAAFEMAAGTRPPECVHVEYFTPKAVPSEVGGFTVELVQSRKEFFIPPGKTILEVLSQAGIRVASSCEQGICGACETRILGGIPDHRDSVLSPVEKAENRTAMICCAGSKTERLILDL